MPKPRKNTGSRNPLLAQGVTKFGRSASFHRTGRYKVKNLKGVAKAAAAPATTKSVTFGKGKRTVAVQKASRFYPAEDVSTPLYVRKTARPAKVRASLQAGTVAIVLAGRFRGKRVVVLSVLPSGLLLVTGALFTLVYNFILIILHFERIISTISSPRNSPSPLRFGIENFLCLYFVGFRCGSVLILSRLAGPYKINGVPLRRINPAYVIATSTKVDLKGVKLDAKFNDAYFKRPAAKKSADALFEKKDEKAKAPLSTAIDCSILLILMFSSLFRNRLPTHERPTRRLWTLACSPLSRRPLSLAITSMPSSA